MKTISRILSLIAAGALATGALVATSSGSASAATNLGTLTIVPGSGNEITTMDATTSAHCNPDDTGIVVYMSGPGIGVNPVLQGFTDIWLVDGTSGLSFPVTSIFRDVWQNNSIASPNGAYTIRLACIGADYYTETGEFTQTVNMTATGLNAATFQTVVAAQNTTTTLSQNSASGSFGDSVTLTAAVAPAAATGTVQFMDGATALGSPQPVSGGSASLTTSALTVGSHSITAVYSGDSGYNGSTSNPVTHTVSAVNSSVVLTSNGPTAQFTQATFTATVAPASATGTVTFKEGSTTIGTATVSAGVATFSTSNLPVGPHPITAHFAPSGSGVSASDSTALSHVVTAASITPVNENIIVNVPAGALTISLDNGADGQVDLGDAALNATGDYFTASGPMDRVKVTDTRAGDPGWTASGLVTDFTKPAGATPAGAVNGYNLGWTPSAPALAAHQTGFHVGDTVAPATEATAVTVPSNSTLGLETVRELGTAAAGHGTGTAVLAAQLNLNIPTDVPSGSYNATLTLTVM